MISVQCRVVDIRSEIIEVVAETNLCASSCLSGYSDLHENSRFHKIYVSVSGW